MASPVQKVNGVRHGVQASQPCQPCLAKVYKIKAYHVWADTIAERARPTRRRLLEKLTLSEPIEGQVRRMRSEFFPNFPGKRAGEDNDSELSGSASLGRVECHLGRGGAVRVRAMHRAFVPYRHLL